MIQIICGVLLVLIGIFVFWKYPIKSDTKSLTLAALLVILAVVLKRFSIMIPLFGFESLKISVEVIPMLLAGVLLAPGYCFIIGLAVDWVGLIIAPTSFPFLGFTLNAVLQTEIPCVYVFSLEQVTISKQVVDITFNIKVFISVLCVIMVSVLFMVMYYYKRKLNNDDYHLFNKWLISVVLVEMAVTFCLTPYWLQVMYGIPFTLSLFIRVIKECIMIPVNIILGYTILRVIKRL